MTTFNDNTALMEGRPEIKLQFDRQLENSNLVIEERKRKSLLVSTAYRLGAYDREKKRRDKYEDQNATCDCLVEVNASQALEENLSERKEDSSHYQPEFEAFKADPCNKVVKLDALITKREEDFVYELRRQATELQELQTKIQEENESIRSACNIVENALAYDRDKIVQNYNFEIDSLISLKGVKESNRRKSQNSRVKALNEKLDRLGFEKHAEYLDMKKKYLEEIEVLENKMLKLEFQNQLNREKLHHECCVLQDKKEEDIILLNKHKQKSATLLEKVKKSKEEYKEFSFRKQNMTRNAQKDATKALHYLTCLKSKSQVLLEVDRQKYKSIMKLHEEDVLEMTRNYVGIIEKISSRILGSTSQIAWAPDDIADLQEKSINFELDHCRYWDNRAAIVKKHNIQIDELQSKLKVYKALLSKRASLINKIEASRKEINVMKKKNEEVEAV
eukprot:CAMPEP_0116076298 /NCGR_PEP_ID=MMETSP0322-20121206/17162_1 /TAXON_ID=163516 /ORGANISM="Leptocylindrus danicus var. apora, Strain B651" /LENGTH=447 /DNA_ID=CAMNT_0003566551 /DNA_START=261 /DNA_END=1604 /DNA_ORIENTATION=-